MYDIEFLDLPPLAHAAGEIRLPGSKSISNRVLLLAALSHGQTTVHDLLASDDTAVMLTALKQLGCTVVQDRDTAVIGGCALLDCMGCASIKLRGAELTSSDKDV